MGIIKKVSVILLVLLLGAGGFYIYSRTGLHPTKTAGQEIDQFNGVAVYYNGEVGNVKGRNLAPDGYNLGLKYQCVEFVKRYYFEHLNHKMPNSYGHAKDFFDSRLANGKNNVDRNLIQYTNGSSTKPRVNDLLIFKATEFNSYGHVAIISAVSDNEIDIIQQNPGVLASSRENFKLKKHRGKWRIQNNQVLGWLRKE
ncbi:CHAP domain-containing protein [Gillisia sp. Q332]|uniref:CHAP domain-containing protein n=1 Tax=Gillisia xinjiangensis TaxID=3384765 RepID=UPI00391A23AA